MSYDDEICIILGMKTSLYNLALITFFFSFNSFSQRFAVIGDAGYWNSTPSVKNSIISSGVKNLILPGDNLYDTPKNMMMFGNWLRAGV